MTTLPVHYLLAWFPMVVVALLVGALRDFTYGKRMAPAPARRLTFTLAFVALGVYVALLAHWIPFASPRQALLVGGIWVVITAALDALLRALAPAAPPSLVDPEDLFATPAPRHSPLGLLLLLWIGLAPWIFETLLHRT